MGAKTGPKIDEKSDLQGKAQKLTKTHYLLHFSHIGHLKNRAFLVHFGLLKPASRESPPESMKKDTQKAPKAAPISKIGPKGSQKETPKSTKNRTEIDLGSFLGTPWATKAEKSNPNTRFRSFGGAPGAQNGAKKEARFT